MNINTTFTINNFVYFFFDTYYLRYDIIKGDVDNGYPKPISQLGLPFTSNIDAILNYGNGKLYFFKKNLYIGFDIHTQMPLDHHPRRICDGWNNLPFAKIDAVFNNNNGKAYFFSGNKYARYDLVLDRMDDGFPKKISNKNWRNLPFNSDINTAFTINDLVYFFQDEYYCCYDLVKGIANKPRYIQNDWKNVILRNEDIINLGYLKYKFKKLKAERLHYDENYMFHKQIRNVNGKFLPPDEDRLLTTKSKTQIPLLKRINDRVEGLPLPLERSVRHTLNSNDVSTIKQKNAESGAISLKTYDRENNDVALVKGTNNPFRTDFNDKFLFRNFRNRFI
jgi:hypothetical protein